MVEVDRQPSFAELGGAIDDDEGNVAEEGSGLVREDTNEVGESIDNSPALKDVDRL